MLEKSVFFKESLEEYLGFFEPFDVFFGVNCVKRKIISFGFEESQDGCVLDPLILDAVEVVEGLGFIRKALQ